MVPHANWHHSTVRQSEHTKYSTYQQQCNGIKCSLWGMKMTTLPKLVECSFIPYMPASVIECRSVGSCSSSQWVVSRAHDHRSPLSAATHTASPWHRMPVRGMETIFKNLCYNTDWVCFAKTVSPAPVFVLSYASYPGLGTRDPYSYWGRWHSMATHT